MPPKGVYRGLKRAQSATPGPAEKKPKVDGELDGVLEALRNADLPEVVRNMLLNTAGAVFVTPAKQRDEPQVSIVSMIGETLVAGRTSLEKVLDSRHAALAEVEAFRSTGELTAAEVQEKLAESNAATEANKKIVSAASGAYMDAKKILAEAEEAQRSGDAALNEAAKNKKELETALADNFLPVKEGTCSADETHAHVAILLPLCLPLGLDESLATAIPCSLPKPPAERGVFDKMVVDQLDETIRNKVEELGQTLGAGADGAKQRAAAVEAADTACKQALERQTAAAVELRNTSNSDIALAAEFEEVKTKLATFDPDLKAALEARKISKDELEAYVSWNVACFEVLRDKPTAEEVAEAKAKKAAIAAEKAAANAALAAAKELEANPAVEEITVEVVTKGELLVEDREMKVAVGGQ